MVYIFTCIPNNNLELAKFLGKTYRSNKRFSHKDVFEEVFNQTNNPAPSHIHTTSKKSVILTNFQNADNPIRLSVIDTAPLFESGKCPNERRLEHFDCSVKNTFDK